MEGAGTVDGRRRRPFRTGAGRRGSVDRREEDFAFYEAAADLHGGSAELLSVDPMSGVEEMRRGLQRWVALGTEAFVTWSRSWLPEGNIEDAAAEFRNVITSARAARARGPELQSEAALDALTAGAG